MSWIREKYEELKIKYILWSEDRKRGGKEARDLRRKERRASTIEIKESLFLDLQQGWLLGDFRMLPDHVEIVRNWPREPLKTIADIHRHYRGWHNEELRK